MHEVAPATALLVRLEADMPASSHRKTDVRGSSSRLTRHSFYALTTLPTCFSWGWGEWPKLIKVWHWLLE